mgnify:CR=1 FL=1
MIDQSQHEIIINTLSPYMPNQIGIFGSFARNENKPDSDLDILVDFKNTVNLLDLIGLEQTLTELLKIKVDLITYKSINPRVKPFIEKDLKIIFK